MPTSHTPVLPKLEGPISIDVKIVAILLVINSVVNLALVVLVLMGIIPRLGIGMKPPLSYIGRYGFYALLVLLHSLMLWVCLGLWKRKRNAAKLGAILAVAGIALFYFTNVWTSMPMNAILAAYFMYLYLYRRRDFLQ